MKPKCKLSDENGNIFNLLAIASKALTDNEQGDKVIEMQNRALNCQTYKEALKIIGEYVEIY